MDGKLVILGISTILFVGTYANTPPKEVSVFHCARDLPGCGGGTNSCNLKTGVCTCTGSTGGYDCSIPDTSKACDATDPCVGDQTQTCYEDDGGDPQCACKPGFTGTTCGDKVSSVTCDATAFKLTWKTYIASSKQYPAPNLAEGCVANTDDVYTILHDPNGSCGVTKTVSALSATVYDYKVNIVFQSLANFLTKTDYVVKLKCSFDSSSQAVTGTNLNSVDYNESGFFGPLLSYSFDSNVTVVGETFLSTDDGANWGEVTTATVGKIGDLFKLKVTLPHPNPATNDPYDSILLVTCKADDGADGADENEITLLTSSCPAPGKGLTVLYDIDWVSKTELCIIINVFKRSLPADTTKIRLQCDVKVCLSAEAAGCAKKICTPGYGLPGAGRKKRSVDVISNTTVGTISAWLPVGGPVGTQGQQQVVAEECSLSQEFIIIIVILCLLILLLAVSTVYFALKRISKRRSKVDDMQTVYSNKT